MNLTFLGFDNSGKKTITKEQQPKYDFRKVDSQAKHRHRYWFSTKKPRYSLPYLRCCQKYNSKANFISGKLRPVIFRKHCYLHVSHFLVSRKVGKCYTRIVMCNFLLFKISELLLLWTHTKRIQKQCSLHSYQFSLIFHVKQQNKIPFLLLP